jgi:hypothetical protein
LVIAVMDGAMIADANVVAYRAEHPVDRRLGQSVGSRPRSKPM